MPATVNLHAYLRAVFTKTNASQLYTPPTQELLINLAATLASGTTAGLADKAWGISTTCTTTPTDHDLRGALDAFGDATVFAEVNGVFVAAPAANTGTVIVGAGTAVLAAGAAAHTRIVQPGGFDFWFSPADPAWPTAAGTTDLLRVTAGAGTQSYSLLVIGRSA